MNIGLNVPWLRPGEGGPGQWGVAGKVSCWAGLITNGCDVTKACAPCMLGLSYNHPI